MALGNGFLMARWLSNRYAFCALLIKKLVKNHKLQGLDYRIDMVKPCSILVLKIPRKDIIFVHRRGITDSLIGRKLVV